MTGAFPLCDRPKPMSRARLPGQGTVSQRATPARQGGTLPGRRLVGGVYPARSPMWLCTRDTCEERAASYARPVRSPAVRAQGTRSGSGPQQHPPAPSPLHSPKRITVVVLDDSDCNATVAPGIRTWRAIKGLAEVTRTLAHGDSFSPPETRRFPNPAPGDAAGSPGFATFRQQRFRGCLLNSESRRGSLGCSSGRRAYDQTETRRWVLPTA